MCWFIFKINCLIFQFSCKLLMCTIVHFDPPLFQNIKKSSLIPFDYILTSQHPPPTPPPIVNILKLHKSFIKKGCEFCVITIIFDISNTYNERVLKGERKLSSRLLLLWDVVVHHFKHLKNRFRLKFCLIGIGVV